MHGLSKLLCCSVASQGYEERGKVYFEFVVPRLGKRIDVVLVIDHVLFVLEFKVGEKDFTRSGIDQVWDYALDLKNFHESSHAASIAPLLIATGSRSKLGRHRYDQAQRRCFVPNHCFAREHREMHRTGVAVLR
jgi:hypothetical protein